MIGEITKQEFKILEAVLLGYDYWYNGPKNRVPISDDDREWALETLPTMPSGWFHERHSWDSMKY